MEENKQLHAINPNSLLSLNKSDLKSLAKKAIVSVNEGWLDPLTALVTVKKHQEVLSAMEEELKPLANDRTVPKGYSEYGVEVGQSMVGVKYDFASTNDAVWEELNKEMLELKEKIKARETFLKALTKDLTEVDDETGEIRTIHPPVKSGALGLVLKIK